MANTGSSSSAGAELASAVSSGVGVRPRGRPGRKPKGSVGLASTGSVSYQLGTLQKKGYLRTNAGRARTVELLLPGHPAVRLEPDRAADEAAGVRGIGIPSQQAVYVPLVGRIAAGGPVLADEAIDDVYPLPRQLVGEVWLMPHRFCGVGTPVFKPGRKRRFPSRRVTFTDPD